MYICVYVYIYVCYVYIYVCICIYIYNNPKKTLNLFNRTPFHFLRNLCQLCLATLSTNILKHTALRECAIKMMSVSTVSFLAQLDSGILCL